MGAIYPHPVAVTSVAVRKAVVVGYLDLICIDIPVAAGVQLVEPIGVNSQHTESSMDKVLLAI